MPRSADSLASEMYSLKKERHDLIIVKDILRGFVLNDSPQHFMITIHAANRPAVHEYPGGRYDCSIVLQVQI